VQYTINHDTEALPVESYLSLQGRYKHLGQVEIDTIQAETNRAWSELKRRARAEC